MNETLDFMSITKPTCFEEFRRLLHSHEKDPRIRWIRTSLDIMASLLQTPEQIKTGLEDIFCEAAKDNFKCMDNTCLIVIFSFIDIEIFVRPSLHTKRDLSHAQFISLVLDEADMLAKKYRIRHGIGLCIDNSDDGFTEIAKVVYLAVQNRERICGFGFFGFGKCTMQHDRRRITKLYDILKKHQIDVCISAGKTE